MKTKNAQILYQKRARTQALIATMIAYCRSLRMRDYDISILSPDELESIGNEVIDLFVYRMQKFQNKTPPE